MKRLLSFFSQTLSLLILAGSCTTGFAQVHKFTGHYISINRDTIAGTFPAYRQWNFNPGKVRFVADRNGEAFDLTPSNTLAFTITGYDTYLAYTGKRLTNPIDYQSAGNAAETDQFEEITTFLREIARQDDVAVYAYKDQGRLNLYYTQGGGKPEELLQKAAFVNNSFWESMTYKNQLTDLFPAQRSEIEQLQYSEPGIERLFRVNRASSGVTSMSRSTKSRAHIFLVGGVAANKLRFETNQSMAFSTMHYTSSVVPIGGIGYMIPLQRNFSRIFFFPEVKIFSFKHSGTTVYNEGYPAFKNTFKAAPMITTGIYFGYHLVSRKNLSLSLAPGAGLSFLAKNRQIDEAKYSPTQTRILVTDMNRVAPLFDIQAMATINKKYMLWVSYNLPTGVTDSPSARGRLQSVQGGVGFKFGE